MQADSEVCMCFHVSFRKLIHYARRNKISRPSQLSECFSAGTGCGWCRPVLEQLGTHGWEELPDIDSLEQWVAQRFPEPVETYASKRLAYRQQKQQAQQ